MREYSITTQRDWTRSTPLAVVQASVSFYDTPKPIDRSYVRLSRVPKPVLSMFRRRDMVAHGSTSPGQVLERGGPDASCPDVAAALGYQNAHRALAQSLSALSGGDDLAQAHADEVGKAVPEYGYYGGWDVPPDLVTDPSDVEPIPVEVWRYLRDSLDPSELASRPPLTVKTGTNHGAPTWDSSLEDHLAHFAMAAEIKDGKSLERVFRRAYKILDAELPPGPVLTMLTRTGPLKKPVEVAEFVNGRLSLVASATGVFCRRRQVRTVPTCFNEALRPVVMAITRALKSGRLGRCFAHYDAAYNNRSIYDSLWAAQQHDRSAVTWSDDASNFDDSVNVRHLSDLYTHGYPLDAGPRELLFALTSAPVLSGPLDEGDEGALYARRGTVPSGTISTSLDDAFINAASVIVGVAAACGWTPRQAIAAHESRAWDFRIQGDDTFLIVPGRFKIDVYSEKGANLGFRRTPSPVPIFLKTHHPRLGEWHNLASRATVRSAWRERRANGPAHELLGAAIRWELARRDPYFEQCWACYTQSNVLAQEYDINRPEDFFRVTENAGFLSALDKERETPQGDANWAAQMEELGFSLMGRDFVDGDATRFPSVAGARTASLALDRLGGLRSFLESRTNTSQLTDGSFRWERYLIEKASKDAR